MLGSVKGTQAIILASMSVAVGNTVVSSLTTEQVRAPAPRILIGGFVATIGLLVASEAYPQIAESLAILIMLATLFGPNGTALVNTITRLTKPTTKG